MKITHTVTTEALDEAANMPVLDLTGLDTPVIIESLELLKKDKVPLTQKRILNLSASSRTLCQRKNWIDASVHSLQTTLAKLHTLLKRL